jgi:hypothetical protein
VKSARGSEKLRKTWRVSEGTLRDSEGIGKLDVMNKNEVIY